MNPHLTARATLPAALAMLGALHAMAGLPEPDTVFHGTIAHNGAFITAADTDCVVEIRAAEDGPALSSYRMGDDPALGDRYVVRARVESGPPLDNPLASLPGDTIHVVVSVGGDVIYSVPHEITLRGVFVNLNFGDVDSDTDGMSDTFEETYFGSKTGGEPDADPDGDGRPNRREFLDGTNPLVADGRHPADLNPADDALTITEVTEYTLAWQLGNAWPVEPFNIPIAYVTRANLLWHSGEAYVFDNDPPTNAPNWWVSAPPPGSPASPALAAESPEPPSRAAAPGALALHSSGPRNSAEGTVPSRFRKNVPFLVENHVEPGSGVTVYAVEDTVPEGVIVRHISHDGRFDRVNRKVKWGPYFDSNARTLTYEITALETAPATIEFIGTASFDGTDVAIAGRRVAAGGEAGTAAELSIVRSGTDVELVIRGVAGEEYVIEESTDLRAWRVVKSARAEADGSLRISVGAPAGAAFYRARSGEGSGSASAGRE